VLFSGVFDIVHGELSQTIFRHHVVKVCLDSSPNGDAMFFPSCVETDACVVFDVTARDHE